MKNIIIIAFISINLVLNAQPTEKILREGKMLYQLEKSAWIGTDDFLDRFSNKANVAGGYVSYVDNNVIINLFFDNSNSNNIIVRYKFDNSVTNIIEIDTLNHIATQKEKDLIEIRKKTLLLIGKNEGNFFKFYKKSNFNIIPIIDKNIRKAIILSSSTTTDSIAIGNDYELTFNKKLKILKKEKIHNSLLWFPSVGNVTYHSHVNSQFINSTDICTLLLYKQFIEWKQHIVTSKKYVSIFDIEKENLVIITREAWDKIYKFQQKKNE